MVKTINVVVLGESSVGKTALLNKFANPDAQITPSNPEDYWNWQEATTSMSKQLNYKGNTYNLDITEVPGSKGRMSNHWQITQSAAKADVMLFCYNPQNLWSLRSVEYTHRLASESRSSSSTQLKKRSSLRMLGSKKQKGQPKGTLPLVICETFSGEDVPGVTDANAKETADKFNAKLVKSSALKNTGITQVFEACIDAYLNSRAEEEKKAGETSAVDPAATTTEAATPAVPAAQTQEKEGLSAIWSKLMAKFVKGEKDTTVAAPAADAAEVKNVDAEVQDVAPVA